MLLRVIFLEGPFCGGVYSDNSRFNDNTLAYEETPHATFFYLIYCLNWPTDLVSRPGSFSFLKTLFDSLSLSWLVGTVPGWRKTVFKTTEHGCLLSSKGTYISINTVGTPSENYHLQLGDIKQRGKATGNSRDGT